MKDFNYVYQENSKEKTKELLGFNLTERESTKLMYSLGTNGNSSIGNKFNGDENLRNVLGCHSKKFKNATEAFDELITKPDAFNNALDLLNKAGFDVVQKGIVSKKQKVVSYQMEKTSIFGL